MGGIPPAKRINKTGAFRHSYQKKKRVGIDIGPSTIAIVSEETVSIQQLAPDVPLFEREKDVYYASWIEVVEVQIKTTSTKMVL